MTGAFAALLKIKKGFVASASNLATQYIRVFGILTRQNEHYPEIYTH